MRKFSTHTQTHTYWMWTLFWMTTNFHHKIQVIWHNFHAHPIADWMNKRLALFRWNKRNYFISISNVAPLFCLLWLILYCCFFFCSLRLLLSTRRSFHLLYYYYVKIHFRRRSQSLTTRIEFWTFFSFFGTQIRFPFSNCKSFERLRNTWSFTTQIETVLDILHQISILCSHLHDEFSQRPMKIVHEIVFFFRLTTRTLDLVHIRFSSVCFCFAAKCEMKTLLFLSRRTQTLKKIWKKKNKKCQSTTKMARK